jgi:predicted DsbA family dithiol-disulfide isomerase
MRTLAADIPGLDFERALDASTDTAVDRRLAADASAARNAGVQGTPTLLAGHRGGTLTRVAAEDAAGLGKALDALVAGHGGR